MDETTDNTLPPRWIEQLFLRGMEFTIEASPTFGQRLNLITGDNSTGKTVVLDALWWALTATWATEMVVPRRTTNGKAHQGASENELKTHGVASIGLRWSDGTEHHARFDPAKEEWPRPEGWSRTSSLVLYARIDEGFSLFDPVRALAAGALSFKSADVLHGLRMDNGTQPCNGLIEDLVHWQSRRKWLFDRMNDVLAAMSPSGAPMGLGEPEKISIQDAREFPTVNLPYGTIPVTHASSAVQRILGLAYLLVWAWHEHEEAARLAQVPLARSVVVLVDEIEAHLHPEWQRRILDALLRAVALVAERAKTQVFVVTHAPLVVASAESVFDVKTDKLFHFALREGSVAFEEISFEKKGEVSEWLTSKVFGLREARSIEAEAALVSAKALLRQPSPSVDELRSQHAELKRALPATDPFFVRWVNHLRRQGIEP